MPIALFKRLNTESRIQFEIPSVKLFLEADRSETYSLVVVWLLYFDPLLSHSKKMCRHVGRYLIEFGFACKVLNSSRHVERSSVSVC